MRYIARFNSTDFCITQLPTISDSSRETKYSDIEIDFRGKAETLLPIQYQEIKIIQIDDEDNEVLFFTGYADNVEYPKFSFEDQPFLLTIGLLSPYAYASKRTVQLEINNVALYTAISTVLAPLIADGFTIEENGLDTDKYVNEIYQSETVEKIMNYLANKFNFVWYIDKDKKIYLKKINTLKGQEPTLLITDTERNYLKSIKPLKNIVDYANKLTIKNAIVFSYQQLVPVGTVLNDGETYMFKYPISISENSCFRLDRFAEVGPNETYAFCLNTGTDTYCITIDLDAETITFDSEIGIDGQDNDTAGIKILLVADVLDNTKITGFKWVAASETVTTDFSGLSAYSLSSLKPYKSVYIDANEIDLIKTNLSTTGTIEKIIDTFGKYFTYEELENYAISLFSQNNTKTNEIDCVFKGKTSDSDFIDVLDKLSITNTISVNLPTFKIEGTFIITERKQKINKETMELTISARNINLNENYIDLFRYTLQQENTDQQENTYVTFYSQDNKTVVSKEIYVNGVRVDV